MATQLLNTEHKLLTQGSGTTIYIDYSAIKKILEVEFDGGHVYHYLGVEPEIWEEYRDIIESGSSSGIYVNTRIKPRYKYRRVR